MKKSDLQRSIREAGLSGLPVCAHTSLSSFGHVEGGADALLDAYLDEGCTLVVPTFVYTFMRPMPKECAYRQNAMTGQVDTEPYHPDRAVYSPSINDLSQGMGALPRAVLLRPERVRGANSINSISAIGPLAGDIIGRQTELDVYAPYARAAELDGKIALMGVNLTRCTPLHWAEQLAGKTLFVRWSYDGEGNPVECSVGSCSDGFERFAEPLARFETRVKVGESLWRIYPMREAMQAAAECMKADAGFAHCEDPTCGRCNDMQKGGLLR